MIELTNLEYLNLGANKISYIELNSFSSLINIEILILSSNNLTIFDDNLFSPLANLKFLNISFNQLETIQSFLFDGLFKLETLDLSFNRIILLKSFSFNILSNLKSIFLNENSPDLLIESNQTFFQLDSMQSIYLSQSILSKQINQNAFINLFDHKKKQINKTVLSRSYFKSLFLISEYSEYDCNLTLFFIENSIHLNFKTETHIYDYFSECSLLTIKSGNTTDSLTSNKVFLILTNVAFYFFWAILVLILILGLFLTFGETTLIKESISSDTEITEKYNLTKLSDETDYAELNAEVETISIGKLTTSNSNRNEFNDKTTDMKQTAFFQKTLNVDKLPNI